MSGRGVLAWMGIGVAGLVGVALAGAIGGVAWVATDGGERFVANQLHSLLDKQLAAGGVSFERLVLDWGRGIELHDVVVTGSSGADVVRAPLVHAELQLEALLSRQIHVERLRAPDAWVRIGRLPDGQLDLPQPTPSDTPSDPDAPYLPAGLELSVDTVLLTRASVALPDDGVDVDALNLVGGFGMVDRTLRVEDLVASADLADPALGALALAGDVTLDDTDLSVRASLSSEGLVAQIDGGLQLADRLVIDDTHLVTTASRSGLVGWIGGLSGSEPSLPEDLAAVRLDATTHGPLTGLAVDATAHLLDAPEMAQPDLEGTVELVGSVHVPEGAVSEPVRLAMHARVPQLAQLAPVGTPAELGGQAEVVATIELPSDGPTSIVGEVRSPAIELAETRMTDVSVPAEVRVTDDGGTQVEAMLRVAAVHASDVVAAPVTGEVDLIVAPSGSLGGDAHVELPSVKVPLTETRTPHLDLRTDARFDGDWIAVDARVLDHDDSDLRLDLDGGFDTAAQTARIDELLLVVRPDETMQNPEPWQATLAGDGVVDVRASLDGVAGSLWLEAERLGGRRQTGRVDVEGADLAYLRELGHRYVELPPIQGVVDGTVELDHGNDVPPALQATVSVDGLQVVEDVHTVDVQLEGHIVEEVLEATVEATSDEGLRRWAYVDASIPLKDRGMWLACEAQGRLRLDVPTLGWRHAQRLSTAALELPSDRLAAPQAGGWVELQGDLCDPETQGAVEAAAQWDGRPISLKTTVEELGDHRLELLASVRVDEVERASAQAHLGHAPLNDLIEGTAEPMDAVQQWDAMVKLLGVPANLAVEGQAGRAYGRVGVEGQHTELQSAHAGLQVAEVEVDGEVVSAAMHAETDDELMMTAEVRARMPGVTGLDASGRLDLDHLLYSDDPLATVFALDLGHSELPLEAIAKLSGGALTDGEGVLIVDGKVGGRLDDVRGDLAATIDGGRLTVAGTGIRYDRMVLDAQVEGQELRIEKLELGSRPRYGRYALEKQAIDLKGSGTIALLDDLSVAPDVDVRLDRFWAIANGTGLLEVSGDLSLQGEYPDLSLTGALEVDDARFDLPRHLFVSAADVHVHEDITFVGEVPDRLEPPDVDRNAVSALDVLEVDAELDLERSVNVSATVPLASNAGALGTAADLKAEASLDGELDVSTEGGEPSIDGAVKSEGDVRLLNAQFDIERGTVSFNGTEIAKPQLDVALRRSGGEYGDVTARISGTPKNLTLEELASEDYGDQADVMALLLFGRPLSELDEGESQGADQLVQSALLSVVGSQVEEALGTSVVDTVRYDPGDGLSLGWSISTDAFLTLALDPTAEDDENMTVARINWLIGKLTEVELATGDAGDSEGWLLLETRF